MKETVREGLWRLAPLTETYAVSVGTIRHLLPMTPPVWFPLHTHFSVHYDLILLGTEKVRLDLKYFKDVLTSSGVEISM